ncbi:hypothetical protein R3P38DRAFT_3207780 [Favolaschia claudopus]|uniref:Uncharacterized protein n=1 Tax=Favolaschia claudopus TaxID=2862362 RepID=A0AAW0AIW8_9AGAR
MAGTWIQARLSSSLDAQELWADRYQSRIARHKAKIVEYEWEVEKSIRYCLIMSEIFVHCLPDPSERSDFYALTTNTKLAPYAAPRRAAPPLTPPSLSTPAEHLDSAAGGANLVVNTTSTDLKTVVSSRLPAPPAFAPLDGEPREHSPFGANPANAIDTPRRRRLLPTPIQVSTRSLPTHPFCTPSTTSTPNSAAPRHLRYQPVAPSPNAHQLAPDSFTTSPPRSLTRFDSVVAANSTLGPDSFRRRPASASA